MFFNDKNIAVNPMLILEEHYLNIYFSENTMNCPVCYANKYFRLEANKTKIGLEQYSTEFISSILTYLNLSTLICFISIVVITIS